MYDQIKIAHQIGAIQALRDAGYSDEMIKQAGPWWAGAIAPLLQRAAAGIGKTLGAGGRWTKFLGAKRATPFEQFLGGGLQRAGGGLSAGLESLADKPWSTLGRGAIETGKGLMSGGRGVGGVLGKGILGGTVLHSLFGDND